MLLQLHSKKTKPSLRSEPQKKLARRKEKKQPINYSKKRKR
jgi:hypothetical protein